MAKDLEFAVDDPSGKQKIFRSFKETCEFAVIKSASSGEEVVVDVLTYSRAGARRWGGEHGVEEYNADPDASVHDRIVIRAESQGRVA